MPNVSDPMHLPVCFWISDVDGDTVKSQYVLMVYPDTVQMDVGLLEES